MIYRIRYHPSVGRDLDGIAQRILEFAGPKIAEAKLDEILQTIRRLSVQPHIGSLRQDIAPGLRAIPAGRKGVVAFVVDDEAAQVLIYAVTYGGADWAMRTKLRR
ncbi:type II toxin-antitoxin system RelE/ParE family toxin [Oleomonas cavernae]|uniref:Type II toxin-antitoxin system RelE/ParE family toxin n=1 Tax=Oleomonas cavernae TaxID=2320859 RepID=A0A418W9D9_9PROT|nr:type II toxin-antitoxin system RelE/ParE family toxin [Oleomonas cavernae]RJF86623.1 type II toxin-antitoxin system RelE/ParE family toxin [Oleomonas cavernae]